MANRCNAFDPRLVCGREHCPTCGNVEDEMSDPILNLLAKDLDRVATELQAARFTGRGIDGAMATTIIALQEWARVLRGEAVAVEEVGRQAA